MKAIMIMFDSLNRHFLPCYGNDWVHAPNFTRLQEKSLTFNQFYASSLPCMPARRELHTGRYNFLHRSWGPLEPFDVSMPQILSKNGVYTHLVTDHFHYFEDGGATYHSRYNTWEFVRGQQGDPWKGKVADLVIPPCENPRKINLDNWRQDWVNREAMDTEEKQPMPINFNLGIDFIEHNKHEDNWFLQIETFDPHEPFYTMDTYKKLYSREYHGKHYDWPNYGKADTNAKTVDHVQKEYAALVSMCDVYLGKVLDVMDAHNMWEDTMLIVNTDHGFMLGEKEWYGKNIQPFYNEVSHVPFFIYDPRVSAGGTQAGSCRESLCQTIDIAPTLLEFFGQEIPATMQGKPLRPVIEQDKPIREAGLFGMHGGHVNIVDGSYVYMRANVTPDNMPLYEYTLMPTHMREMFRVQALQQAELINANTYSFATCPVMKIPATSFLQSRTFGHLLFDLTKDPNQEQPVNNLDIELDMAKKLIALLQESEAPEEQYIRLGLQAKDKITKEDLYATVSLECTTFDENTPLGVLLEDKQARQVLEKHLGTYLNHPMLAMALGISLRKLQEVSQGKLTDAMVEAIVKELRE